MVAESGSVLAGRYRLSQPLSKGGMSSVWVAHDLSLDVQVAIKLIRVAERSKDPAFADEMALRLVHEARVIAKIRHPAIVTVIDVAETADGEPFIVMELLEGEDLETIVRRDGAMPPVEAVRHLLPILGGMIAAHEKGVIHRDLKPANVFLAKQDDGRIQPKLLDFGIAKSNRADRLGITRQGETMGSPAYMSPEQVRGDETDERSDVWGACMTLYELISGKLPFERGTHIASMLAILEGQLEPLDCDIDLSLIVRRGLEPDPSLRWPSPVTLGRELASWLERQGVNHDSAGGAIAIWLDKTSGGSGTDRPVSIPSAAPVAAKPSNSGRALAAVAIASLLSIAITLGVVLGAPSNANDPLPGAQPLGAPDETTTSKPDEIVPPPPTKPPMATEPKPAAEPVKPATEPVKPAIEATTTKPKAPPKPSPTPSDVPTEPSTSKDPGEVVPTPSVTSPTPTAEPSLDPE